MSSIHYKGESLTRKNLERRLWGEPKANEAKNRTPHSHYKTGEKATRKKGRNRFKTGYKTQKRAK